MAEMSTEARELQLYADNSRSLYDQKVAIIRALCRRKTRGTYNPVLAVDAWLNWATAAAQAYCKEHGGKDDRWHVMFSPAARREAASAMSHAFEVEYECNQWAGIADKPRA